MFIEDTTECIGTSQTVIDNSECAISLFSLIEEPYNLEQGDSIYAKIIAINHYGESPISLAGNGALVQVVPDAPINLVNDEDVTNAFHIAIDWEPAANDGGSAVLDYRVWYALNSWNYYELTTGVPDSYYVTTFDLVPGGDYRFKVQARNSVGYSLESNEVTIKAARKPDAPTNVQTVLDLPDKASVTVTWAVPYDGGTPLLGYKVYF